MSQGCSVLIVDDVKSACAALGAILRENGIEDIDICFDGESALERIVNQGLIYDAIFIDLHLKGMDGLELIHQLHTHHYRGAIVVVSALERKIIELTLEVVSDYNLRVLGALEKPFNYALVAFLVKRINLLQQNTQFSALNISRREFFSALKSDFLQCYFQPKISAENCRITGLECLIRMNIPGIGAIPAQQVVHTAEKYDFMEALTDAVLANALPGYLAFRKDYEHECHIAFNLSPLQLRNQFLPESLSEYLDYYAIRREEVMMEIAEHDEINDTAQMKNINRLRINGYKLSLDDYGSGCTNLRQLKKFPFNEIKLDALFVNGVSHDKCLQAMIRSIKQVSEEMGLQLVAEGVENANDYKCLNELGVNLFQGFLFCRPRPMDEITRWYRSWDKTILTSSKPAIRHHSSSL
ncbi:Oxygen sensor protein DosP [Thalassocella blandensis]|nr:Oxygen sensor protein DosP [Thalassocella blandensis]